MLIKGRVLDDVESKQYTIRFAKTEQEVDAALKLRYNVFKKELNRNFKFDKERDKDEYDDQAHHLIVIENESESVVGTYRMQTWEQARSGNGFVSSERFHINQFPESVLSNAVEVGRACISKEHRNGRVLFLLWKGFAGYLTHFEKRYLFGYSAFESNNPPVLFNTYRYLKEVGKVHPDYDIEVRDRFKLQANVNGIDTDKTDIPPLLKNYLDVGCYVCSKPSIDENNLSHCIILLDIETISGRIKKLFFG